MTFYIELLRLYANECAYNRVMVAAKQASYGRLKGSGNA